MSGRRYNFAPPILPQLGPMTRRSIGARWSSKIRQEKRSKRNRPRVNTPKIERRSEHWPLANCQIPLSPEGLRRLGHPPRGRTGRGVGVRR